MPDAPHDERLQKALDRARQLLAKEDYGHTIELCQKILAAYPGQAEAASLISEAQGKANARLVEDIFAYAERLVGTADYDLAIEQIQKIFEFDPEHARAKERIAQIEAMKSGGSMMDDDALPDPSDLLKDASSGAFGIDESDPFSLGDDAPPLPPPPVAAPAPPRPAKVFEVEDDMSSALVTSENMHEAVSEFAARVSDNAKSDIIVDEPEEDLGLDDVPGVGLVEEEAGFEDSSGALSEGGGFAPDDDAFASAAHAAPGPMSASFDSGAALLDDAEAPTSAESGLAQDEERQIAELLKKGQSYFERGQCQLAIDTWYQILLVDENHAAALKSIAKAKDELAMQGKRVHLDLPEQVLAPEGAAAVSDGGAGDALTALAEEAKNLLDAGKYAEAIQKCEHIISIEPGHMEANRIIHEASLKLKARERVEAAKKAAATPDAGVVSASPSGSPFKGNMQIAAASQGNRAVLMIAGGAVALALLGAGAYFLFSSFGKPAPPSPAPPRAVAKAEPKPEPVPEPEPPPVETSSSDAALLAERLKRSDELFVSAQKFFAAKKYQEAADAVRESLVNNPTNLEAMDFKVKADLALKAFTEEAARYDKAMSSYREGNYEDALWNLYRMTEPRFYSDTLQQAVAKGYYSLTVDPKTVERYQQNAWYNAGVTALKGANTEVAGKAFRDYLLLRPDDAEARKHLEVSTRYHNRPKDENYRQYVEFLKLRD